MNVNVHFLVIQTSLKFVANGPIKNKPALVHIMAWRRTDDNPLSEPTMALLINANRRMRHLVTCDEFIQRAVAQVCCATNGWLFAHIEHTPNTSGLVDRTSGSS